MLKLKNKKHTMLPTDAQNEYLKIFNETFLMEDEELYEYFSKAARKVSSRYGCRKYEYPKIEVPLYKFLLYAALATGQRLGRKSYNIINDCESAYIRKKKAA